MPRPRAPTAGKVAAATPREATTVAPVARATNPALILTVPLHETMLLTTENFFMKEDISSVHLFRFAWAPQPN